MPPVKYSGNTHNIEAVSTRSDILTDRGVKMSEMKEWPHLVGKMGEEAKEEISKTDTTLQVDLVPDGYMVTCDFRTDRVRIFLDADGKVTRPPRVG
ncbi:uncharacterized protein [Asterias amurensis]|uniref:uncharacterized protein n=1 Tax=Asterias amurensis TaxID=7602 RepID=UPI003AB60470